MSSHCRPASSSAAWAATMPYSTKLRPHLPQGCMPAPRIATSRALMSPAPRRSGGALSRSCCRPPLPDEVLVVIVLVQRAEDELDLLPRVQGADVGGRVELAQDDHAFLG